MIRTYASRTSGLLNSTPQNERYIDLKLGTDVLGTELDVDALVWKVYRDQVTVHDKTVTFDEWNKTLDVLLIFTLNIAQAGLFSAVATAFIVESYKLLAFDRDNYVAAGLHALVVAANTSGTLPALPTPPAISTSPSSLSRWINGLWFMSFYLSVSVALLCILAKQWLEQYNHRNAAPVHSPRQWAHRRIMYYRGLCDWRIAGFITQVLPLLLHLSLFLFFAGLDIFVWTLDGFLASILTVTTGVLFTFYLGATILPFWQPECPTSTPLVSQLTAQTPLAPLLAYKP
ncbi:hypothetical protein EXIGLDRAFT_700779 [Exidia glandulosa HHB12029]|uniref:DUF6535 domain-containing protein n=1 Tax=Exidia glandulosa HHB12029 TaxID=1314781 RepID=A0A165LZA6_EXIGL|nr:hypothetical protein EXIGLDRAFT_700779 [Exidia glandulosa HHB12029]